MKSEFQLRKIEPSQIRFIEENKWEYESNQFSTSKLVTELIDLLNKRLENRSIK